MIIELGHFALILALCLTLAQAFFGEAALEEQLSSRERKHAREHALADHASKQAGKRASGRAQTQRDLM